MGEQAPGVAAQLKALTLSSGAPEGPSGPGGLGEPTPAERAWLRRLQPRAPPPPLWPALQAAECPHAAALRVLWACPPLADCGPRSPQHAVALELRRWVAPLPPPRLAPQVRRAAFHLAVQQTNYAFVKIVADLYQVHEEKEFLSSYVYELLADRKYKLACQSAIVLRMQSSVGLKELLVPLLLQDKGNLIDEYLQSCPEQAPGFVRFVDDLVEDKNPAIKIKKFLATDDVPDVRWNKLHLKPLGKLIIRLCKKFDIPFDSCKNLTRNRAYGGIKFLVRQKYEERSISDDVWKDWIQDTIENNPELLGEFIDLVSMYDAKEALKWSRHFGVPEECYPYEVVAYLRNPPPSIYRDAEVRPEDPGTSRPVGYYPLSIAPSDIVFVDDPETFERLVVGDLSSCGVVGIDSEWKPSFGTKPSAVSLIQIATRNKIFILDVFALNRHQRVWKFLYDRLFNDADVVKIGFGLDNDFNEIANSVPGLRDVKRGGLGYLELGQLWKAVVNAGAKLPHPKNNAGEGLSSLAEQCFDLPLNKNEQCSNWENRPLRQSQLEYAALDAYVLLEIYDVLRGLCSARGVDFEEVCYRVMTKSKRSKSRKPKRKGRPKKPQSQNSKCENV